MTKIADGGERISYGEGLADREPCTSKGAYYLISPFILDRLARWYEAGAEKYAPRNWEKGMPFSRCLDSAERHLNKFKIGLEDEDHLAAALWNIGALIHYIDMGMMEFDDLPHYMKDLPEFMGGKPTTPVATNTSILDRIRGKLGKSKDAQKG